ncbi:hypothetical protein [Candidatus Methylacidithermus pantelleriae]|uniref:Uncharacterized protein n=1 Tax=Candidatus Methylacidithermus pantelleriae TaxID=2744239 RepID=A0A8J2FP42_9BACT|nr:hypothetical protein [Candidatus Methylacidithermus pantelleriae]CAF0700166.1 hypothetical protein MPNT_330022 [Candidatus Methylacidithermus pantelleriae]
MGTVFGVNVLRQANDGERKEMQLRKADRALEERLDACDVWGACMRTQGNVGALLEEGSKANSSSSRDAARATDHRGKGLGVGAH